MNYLNLGCGYHYATSKEWTNIDFVSDDSLVIAHNLLDGIPFKNESFDLVYHSHVLEHFKKNDAYLFLKECHRVLKPGGIMRIAIPDLEKIAKSYLESIRQYDMEPNLINKANHEWMIIELVDQLTRHTSGGEMMNYLLNKNILNQDFIFKRIGHESKMLTIQEPIINELHVYRYFRNLIKSFFFSYKKFIPDYVKIGKFRLSGQAHQWMYDRLTISSMLTDLGFVNIQIKDALTSSIPNWEIYNLDSINNIIRKPDSLFIEAQKL